MARSTCRRAFLDTHRDLPTVEPSPAVGRPTAPRRRRAGHEWRQRTHGDPSGRGQSRRRAPAGHRSGDGRGRPEGGPGQGAPAQAPRAEAAHGARPAQVIAMCNQKGGVGKTTSTINLGAALVEYGRRVLLIDLDPQGALSVGLGVPAQNFDRTVYNALMERRTTLADVRVHTDIPGLDLVPSNIDLSAAEVQLVSEVAQQQTLLRVLADLHNDYDYILIDCQPSLGLLTVNALTAAQGVIIPLECEFFSLRGVALLVDTIDKVKERLNPSLEI